MTLATTTPRDGAAAVIGFGWGGLRRHGPAPAAEELTVVVRELPLPQPRHPAPRSAPPRVLVATVVHVAGDLDVATAPLLRTRLEALLSRGGQLVLEVSGVRYVDLAGLAVLVATRARARAREGDLHLVAAGRSLLVSSFRAAGLSFTWPLHPDLPAALNAAVQSPADS